MYDHQAEEKVAISEPEFTKYKTTTLLVLPKYSDKPSSKRKHIRKQNLPKTTRRGL